MQIVLALLYDAVLIGVCGWAFVRGGRPERLGALLLLSASASSSAVRVLHISSWAPGEMVIFTIDCAVIAGFYWLAVTTIFPVLRRWLALPTMTLWRLRLGRPIGSHSSFERG